MKSVTYLQFLLFFFGISAVPAFSHPQYLNAINNRWGSEMLTPGCATCHGSNGLGSIGQAMQAALGQTNVTNPSTLRDAVVRIERLECEPGKTFRDFFLKDYRFPPFNCSNNVLDGLSRSRPSQRRGVPDDVWNKFVENYYKNPPLSDGELDELLKARSEGRDDDVARIIRNHCTVYPNSFSCA